MCKQIGDNSYKVKPVVGGGKSKVVNHRRLKRDSERPPHLTNYYGNDDISEYSSTDSDSDSVCPDDVRIEEDSEGEIQLEPQRPQRPHRERRPPDRYGFGRLDRDHTIAAELMEAQL